MLHEVGSGGAFKTQFWGRGDPMGSATVPHRKSDGYFPIHTCQCDYFTISNSNHAAAICRRMSTTFKSTGVTLGQNLGRKD